MIGKFSILGKYFISTRLKSKGNKVAFLLFYLFPIIFLTYSYSTNFTSDFFQVLTLIALTYSVYEFGYLYNDTITIQKEVEPTLRLNQIEISFFKENIIQILSIRLITFVTLVMLSLYLVIDIVAFILLILLFITFFIYNNVRNKLNLFLHFILVSLKYFIPIIPLFSGEKYLDLLFVLMLYPILNTLERATEKRFSYISPDFFLVDYKNYGRIYYYSITLLLTTSYWYIFDREVFSFVIIFSTMLIARITAQIIVKHRRHYE